MLCRETLALVATLAPGLGTLRATQRASVWLRVSPATLHEVRLRHRRLVTYLDKHHTGYIKYRWELPSGRPDGTRYTFYTGRGRSPYMYSIVYYVNGLRHGTHTEWFNATQKSAQFTYSNGAIHDEYCIWSHLGVPHVRQI